MKYRSIIKNFLIRALFLAVFFSVAHLCGLRRFTSVLCGTLEAEGLMRALSPLLGMTYVISYLAVTVIVPVLLIAAFLVFVFSFLDSRRRGQEI